MVDIRVKKDYKVEIKRFLEILKVEAVEVRTNLVKHRDIDRSDVLIYISYHVL